MNMSTASHLHLPLMIKYLDTGSLGQERQRRGGTLSQILMDKLFTQLSVLIQRFPIQTHHVLILNIHHQADSPNAHSEVNTLDHAQSLS